MILHSMIKKVLFQSDVQTNKKQSKTNEYLRGADQSEETGTVYMIKQCKEGNMVGTQRV